MRASRLKGAALVGAVVTTLAVASCGAPPPEPVPTTSPTPCAQLPTRETVGPRSAPASTTHGPVNLRAPRAVAGERIVGDVVVNSPGVTLADAEVVGTIRIRADHVSLTRVRAHSVVVSSASHVLIEDSEFTGGKDDGIHITSDRGITATDVTVRRSYVHNPALEGDAHYDGIQVRGVDGLVIDCSYFDAGGYDQRQNAGIFLEEANGGNRRVDVRDNLIKGFAWSLMIRSPGVTVFGNTVEEVARWGPCYPSIGPDATFSGNDLRGAEEGQNPCPHSTATDGDLP